MMSEGVLYIANEMSFVDEAKVSAKSVKKVMPNIPITLVTTHTVESNLFDRVIHVDDPNYSFKDKPSYISKSPYDKTIYLDTDIFVYSKFDELFELLDSFDLAAVHDIGHGFKRYSEELSGNLPICYAEYNTGVIAYNARAKQKFSKKWLYNYEQDEKYSDTPPNDQYSFRRTAYSYDGRFCTLRPNYNCLFRYRGLVNGEVKIFHGRLLDISTEGSGKSVEVEDAINILNRENGIRIYDQYMGVVKIRNYNPDKLKFIFDSLYNRGIMATLSDTVEYFKRQGKFLYLKVINLLC